jgi:hypothetical protein
MAEQIEQIEKARGNTKTRASKQELQYTFWFFTLNNYKVEQVEQIEQIFQHECKWYIFQEETGSEGTPHLQGTVSLKKKQRLSELKRIDPSIHWEATKSVKASIEYCTKYETRSGKIFSHGISLPEKVEVEEPFGWQLKVIDILNSKPDKRTIHWFWEPKGNVGKSTLCKYLVLNHNALMLTGKSNDMYNMLAKYPEKRKVIICDIPRSSLGYINYAAIEQIKNGLVFSGKYEGAQLVFNCPHVIVFANELPRQEEMSKDRWNVVRICV